MWKKIIFLKEPRQADPQHQIADNRKVLQTRRGKTAQRTHETTGRTSNGVSRRNFCPKRDSDEKGLVFLFDNKKAEQAAPLPHV